MMSSEDSVGKNLLILDNECMAVPSVLVTIGGHRIVLQCVLPIC